MGRKTIATKVLEGVGTDFEDSEGSFLAIYDFALKTGETIHTNFFTNLHRVLETEGDGVRVQKSIIECKKERTARAISALCKHYGARDIAIYKVTGKLELGGDVL